MKLDHDACFHAVLARDPRFDGRFFVAVSSRGVYCRPICPVRPSKRENMRFYGSAAAAEGAGFRPCLRCRPERAPGLVAVDPAGRLLGAAMAGIEEHPLCTARSGGLAASLGVSDRHLRQVTESELGVSPIQLAQTQRLLLAKRLLDDTSLSLADIARASGFRSVRHLSALIKSRYGSTPHSLRDNPGSSPGLHCRLDFRAPLAWASLLEYLHRRAIPGVESVDATHYRRTVQIDAHQGWIGVSMARRGDALDLEMSQSLAPVIGAVIGRVKNLCDLDAVPDAVSTLLSADPLLRPIVGRLPGLRVPGAFDGFELGVRAILGQQVSVKSATTLAGRWAANFGKPIATPYAALNRLTPGAFRVAALAAEQLAATGMVSSRARGIVALARAVVERGVTLTFAADVERQIANLQELPGIGPWTAQYIAMRALHWPDAFPGTDLMLLRAARATPKKLLARADAWRPWRAYATHYLWQSLGVVP